VALGKQRYDICSEVVPRVTEIAAGVAETHRQEVGGGAGPRTKQGLALARLLALAL
jgi:hypothetical protein